MGKELIYPAIYAVVCIPYVCWYRRKRTKLNIASGIFGAVCFALGLFLFATKQLNLLALTVMFLGITEMVYSEIRDSHQKFFAEDSTIARSKGAQKCKRRIVIYGILGEIVMLLGLLFMFGIVYPSNSQLRLGCGFPLFVLGVTCIMIAGVHEAIVDVVQELVGKKPTDKS